jgi:TolB-like protein
MVFISYARADRPRVAPLAAALTARGYDVWWDALIEGGAGFAKMIEAKLEAADAVMVVWSATSVESDWVRDEAAHARDHKRLVPVSLDGTAAPLGFRQYHSVDLSNWHGRADAPEIANVVAGISGIDTTVSVSAIATNKGLSRRAALIAGGSAVAVIAGGLVVFKPFGAALVANSVAVLPFANMSGDKDQIYFSDGLSEEIRSALARNPQLKVAAPTSANTFRDKSADAKVIGKKLGVAFLLEGSVRRAGDVVRIAAELVDTKTGFSKWSQSFDRQLTDVFAVQSEIASVVSDALAVRVATVKPGVGGTTNVAAYDAFLKGRALFNSDGGEESDRAALAQFDAAIAADPKYAAAYAARSRALGTIASQYAKAGDLRRLYDAAILTAQRAVAIAPELAATQLALGYALYAGRLDVKAARAPYDRAAKLGAGDADVLMLFAIYCSRNLRAKEANSAAQLAMELDRLNPRAFRAGGLVEYAAHNYAVAISLARHALSLNPALRSANGHIGNSQLMLNQLPDARASFQAEKSDLLRLPGLAIVEHRLGKRAAANDAFVELIDTLGDSALYQQAQVLAQWGNSEKALLALDRARALGDSGLLISLVDPLLDPLRQIGQFSKLLAELNFV